MGDRQEGSSSDGGAAAAADLYLDLIKRMLTRDGFAQHYRTLTPRNPMVRRVQRVVDPLLDRWGLALVRPVDPVEPGWYSGAETMVGSDRLDSLRANIEHVLDDGIEGDLMETGVWRGGATIFMRAVLKARRVLDRTVWVADSFAGLPRPDPQRWPQDAGKDYWKDDELAVPVDVVKANFERYGLLDGQVRFLEGWFEDTLPAAPIDRLAILRLDGDLYGSTMVALRSLYPKLTVGGYLIVDDYSLPECKAAVDDFRRDQRIDDRLERVDYTCVFWRRGG